MSPLSTTHRERVESTGRRGGEEGERCAVPKPELGLFLLEEGRCITAFSSLKSC